MRIFPVLERNGVLCAFEVENLLISVHEIVTILSSQPTVSNVQAQRHFAPESAPLVRFTLAGQEFVVEEPFGDSSRYWIGPENPATNIVSTSALAHAFEAYSPSSWRAALAAILTPFQRDTAGKRQ